jgi:hypothetical protein
MRQLQPFCAKWVWWYRQPQQGQVVKIGEAAEDPIQDVVPVAVARWVGAAGEAAAGVSGD